MIFIRLRRFKPGKGLPIIVIPDECKFTDNYFNNLFDITQPNNWKVFITQFRFRDGSPLPHEVDNERIYIDVYQRGKGIPYRQLYNEYEKKQKK